MATPQKGAGELKASLGFTDECGFLVAPLLRRSLAPRGHTPILPQLGRYRYRVSVAAALVLRPSGNLRLYYQTYPELNVNGSLYAQFLRALLWHERGPLVLLQDRGKIHTGSAAAALCKRFSRLHLHLLPPYAPELNPVEYVWTDSKSHHLANFTPQDVPQLDQAIREEFQSFQQDQDRLRSFFARSPLSWKGLTLFT